LYGIFCFILRGHYLFG